MVRVYKSSQGRELTKDNAERYDQLQLENSEIQMRVKERGTSEKGKLSQAIADLEEVTTYHHDPRFV